MNADLDGVEHEDGMVVIHLSPEAATWLAGELPHNDGFTRDIWAAVKAAEEYRLIRAEAGGRLGIRIVMVHKDSS